MAETKEEVIALIEESMAYYLEELHITGQPIPEPATTAMLIEVESQTATKVSA